MKCDSENYACPVFENLISPFFKEKIKYKIKEKKTITTRLIDRLLYRLRFEDTNNRSVYETVEANNINTVKYFAGRIEAARDCVLRDATEYLSFSNEIIIIKHTFYSRTNRRGQWCLRHIVTRKLGLRLDTGEIFNSYRVNFPEQT